MSGAAESISRKIATAGDLHGVVRAMKALTISSIGQYERAVLSLADYYRTVELGLSVCLRQRGPARREPHVSGLGHASVGAIVFGSDQGLVGRFNEEIVEYADKTLGALPGETNRIWAVGERARSLLSETGNTQPGVLHLPDSVAAITPLVGQILMDVQQAIDKGEVVDVYLFHNKPKEGSAYEPICRKLLPLDRSWQVHVAATPWPTSIPPEVIEGPTPAMPEFVRGYFFVLLFQSCAESLAAENASRLAAMQRAEKNIDDMLVDLNRGFRRMRQETIDEELFDVIAGCEALSKPSRGKAGAAQAPAYCR
jgi:F-type H+-transporting ATPase subunit gamma